MMKKTIMMMMTGISLVGLRNKPRASLPHTNRSTSCPYMRALITRILPCTRLSYSILLFFSVNDSVAFFDALAPDLRRRCYTLRTGRYSFYLHVYVMIPNHISTDLALLEHTF